MIDDRLKTYGLTGLAVMAFAANSLLTRRALQGGDIEAVVFVAVRLASGALMLALLAARHPSAAVPRRADAPGVTSLLVYALAFTFAYVQLGAAIGALILFPTVQITLVAIATWKGMAPSARERVGLLTAVAGIFWLLAPHETMPSLLASLSMIVAGAAWGLYSWLGRGVTDPMARTARNFVGASPFALLLLIVVPWTVPNCAGFVLAVASGAITSALGYVIWYKALPRLTVASAGAAQLLVPVLTACAGIALLGERPSATLAGGGVLILGGVWLVMSAARKSVARKSH